MRDYSCAASTESSTREIARCLAFGTSLLKAKRLFELHLHGAKARTAGVGIIDNPLYSPAALPAATGESLEEWQEKIEAWESGWNLQRAA